METLGQRINRLRKVRNLTQEDIAKKFNISIQAVSKWENDISSPDISILLELSELLKVTVEYLLSGVEPQKVVSCVDKKNIKDMVLRIRIVSNDGSKICINLPIPVIVVAIKSGMGVPQINDNDSLKNIDFKEIINLVEQGVVGELMTVESSDGHQISIIVE